MKILHVIPSISAKAGGPSRAILPMCRTLRERGADVLLATTNDGFPTQNGNARTPGQITDYLGQPAIFFSKQIGNSFKYSRPFTEWLNSNVADFDLVHIHAVFNHSCIAAARACRLQGVPYVIRPLGTLDPWSMKQKSWRKRAFWVGGVKRMLQSASAVHYTAKAEQEATEQSLGLNHGVVVPLGIENQTNEPVSRDALAAKLPSLGKRPYVLVLSRLLPTKGIDVLVQAFLSATAQKNLADWCLVLGGEGPARYVDELKQTVARADASRRVLFPGWLDGKEKESALSNASLLALPSYHENFGLCVLEALSCGVPVLVSPHVNLAPDVEKAEAGWVAKVESKALQSALETALTSDEERRRRGAQGRLLAGDFNWSATAEKLMALYSTILQDKQADFGVR